MKQVSKEFICQAFGIGETPVELYKNPEAAAQRAGMSAERTIEASLWLPFAAREYNLSRDIRDYVLVPVPVMITDLPNTNGDSVSLQEFLRFDPSLGQQAFKTFRGKPCLSGDSLVSTDRGLIRIDEIQAKGATQVLTMHGTADIQKWAKTGYHRTLSITTDSGRTLRATKLHEILVLDSDCELRWVEAKDLRVGDVTVARLGSMPVKNTPEAFSEAAAAVEALYKETHACTSPTGVPFRKKKYAECNRLDLKKFPKKMTPELARLIGHLISEGPVVQGGLSYCNSKIELVEDFFTCAETLFGYTPSFKKRTKSYGFQSKHRKNKDMFGSKIFGKDFQLWFDLVGMGKHLASAKEVPYTILESSEECRLAFLSAYIEGDGCLSGHKVQMYTTSKKLALGIKLLIESVGHTAKLTPDLRIRENRQQGYWVRVIKSEALEFMSKVSALSDARPRQVEEIVEYAERTKLDRAYAPSVRSVPYVNAWVRSTVRSHRTGFGPNTAYSSNSGATIAKSLNFDTWPQGNKVPMESVAAFSKVLKKFDPAYEVKLQKLVGNFVFEKVTEITKNEVKEPVYDIQTSAEHFVANGMVVHNCHLEHANQVIRDAKGVILDVFLRPIPKFGGGKYYKLVELMAYDRTKDPLLVNSILTGENNAYSVGFYFKSYTCSICGARIGKGLNSNPCQHTVPKKPTYMNDSGKLVYRQCSTIEGFETSVVTNPSYVAAIGAHLMDAGLV